MSLLLYGITTAGEDAGGELLGVAGAAVSRIGAAGLVALASEHAVKPELTEEALWSFERVLESVMEAHAVLPVRFGALLADAGEVARMLELRRAEFVPKLERVRGAVELSVRGIWSEAPEPAETRHAATGATSGTDYMRARLAPQRRAHELAERVHAQLDDRARASTHRILTHASVPLSAAFLVDRGTEAEFARAVDSLAAELAGTELVCTGPWPAYSFVGGPHDG
ncbi:MAG TPA: GvpL/GvpF family gas vesicle protein [Solirubrobacteraceae bacterium]